MQNDMKSWKKEEKGYEVYIVYIMIKLVELPCKTSDLYLSKDLHITSYLCIWNEFHIRMV